MSGEPCPRCSGKIKVVNSKRVGLASVVRYHGCNRCGHRPPNNKTVHRSTRV